MRPLILLVVVVVVISATIAKGFPSLGPKGNVSTAAQNQKYTYHERRQPAGSESLSAENVNMGQKIDISGKHEFQAPIETDRRGPCPALNALANHGYFPRNGIVNMVSAAQIVNQVYDFSLLLSVYGTIFSGSLLTLSWSIGGPAPKLLNIIPILGGGEGLSKSHNKYETDASATHGDSYLTGGDVDSVQIPIFQKLVDWQKGVEKPNYNLDVYTLQRCFTLQNSISTNPYFFFAPFGVLVSDAGHTFPPAMFSSFTPDHPDGFFSQENLFTFYGVTKNSSTGELTAKRGWESIPDNWYRRPTNREYGLLQFVVELLGLAAACPGSLSIGGNTGKVNTFAGVDLGDLTGGVYNVLHLLDPPQLVCYVYQLVQALVPDLLSGGLLGGVLKFVTSLVAEYILPGMDPKCPGITNWDSSLLNKFPGSKM